MGALLQAPMKDNTNNNLQRVLPDYAGGSLLNLIASCAASRGAVALHPGLYALPASEIADARNLVLLLIDGLGYNYLIGKGAGSFMASRLEGRMTSVFPSTTASAITTTFTGLAPAEHGLTGWFTWFAEANTIAASTRSRPKVVSFKSNMPFLPSR